MGKKYYGGIGTDKGFVMHSPENKYHYSRDDEFHKEGNKRDVDSASNTGGGSSSNDSTHNESSDESPGSVQSNFDAPYDDNRNNRDDELDDFFGDLLSIRAGIALAIESLFKTLMSRSMKRIDFVAVTLMLLVCTRVIGAVFIDSSSLSELNAFAFVVTLSVLGVCTISEKYPANALTALVIACLPTLIEVATTCAVNGSDADAFNRITSWALAGCLGSAALLIAGTLIDPFGDEEEDEGESASMDEGEVENKGGSIGVCGSGSACEDESTTAHEDAACERVFFIPFWGAAIGATAALIWELAPYIAREIAYGAAALYFSYMGGIV
ncbi:hypothetical protein [uncultured Slackia sp.]|uniref:hypothetical protein n=1 Tax=uncultured Slackia sp. TaxID=665903 RepID=UPI0025834C5B|nr:hypothetical protein [uncultured Slackia sp.]